MCSYHDDLSVPQQEVFDELGNLQWSVLFKSGDPEFYEKSKCDLKKAIVNVKIYFGTKLETRADIWQLWQALHVITSHKVKPSRSDGSNA